MSRFGERFSEWQIIGGAVLVLLIAAVGILSVASPGPNTSNLPTESIRQSPVAAAAIPSSTAADSATPASTTTHAARRPKAKGSHVPRHAKKTSTARIAKTHVPTKPHPTYTPAPPIDSTPPQPSSPSGIPSTPSPPIQSTPPQPSSPSGNTGTPTTTTISPPPKPPAPRPTPLVGPVVSASSGRVHVYLHGQNHAAVAGKLWHYKVLAIAPTGKALSGTVVTEIVFHHRVVGRAATHRLRNGRLHDTVTFPVRAVGTHMTLRVVVHTSAGTVTLDWPVKARR